MSRQRYSYYRVSGIDWPDVMPTHWELSKIKYAFQIIGSGSTPNTSQQEFYGGSIPWVTTSELREGEIYETTSTITVDALNAFSALTLYPPNTLLIAMYGATVGRLGILKVAACTNQACCAMAQPVNAITRFVYYWLWATRSHLLKLSSGGGQPNISQEKIKNFPLLIPPITEQSTIVKFLDEQTAKIDALIDKKRQLIALLQEKRTALISHAVTKGLDPSVPMKESGVEWLGEMPAHWQIERSKWLFQVRTERARPGDQQLSATQAYGVIPQQEFMDLEGRQVTQITMHLEQRRHVEIDDFVISMRSFQGGLERAYAQGCIRSSYVVLKPLDQVNVDFFAYLFKSDRYIQALRGTSNFIRDGQDLNFKNFSLVDLPIIPLDEQAEIANCLDQEIGHLDRLCTKLEKTIERLNTDRVH